MVKGAFPKLYQSGEVTQLHEVAADISTNFETIGFCTSCISPAWILIRGAMKCILPKFTNVQYWPSILSRAIEIVQLLKEKIKLCQARLDVIDCCFPVRHWEGSGDNQSPSDCCTFKILWKDLKRQRHKDTKTQRHKDTKTQRHKDTKTKTETKALRGSVDNQFTR